MIVAQGGGTHVPQPLATVRSEPLHGRGSELEAIARALRAARTGAPQVVLVAGEPGAGKTRLAAEAAARAVAAGARLETGELGLRHATGAAADPASPPATGETLLVLDDLHRASPPTARAIRAVLGSPLRLPVVVLGLYSTDELLDADDLLAALIADLPGRDQVEALELRALSAADAAAVLTDVVGRPLDAAESRLAGRLNEAAGGNPLYLRGIAAHLVETGRLEQAADGLLDPADDIPVRLRETLADRVRRRGPAVHQALTVAAVAGQELRLPVVEKAASLDEGEVARTLDVAARAGLLRAAGAAGEQRFAFVHPLLRAALVASLPERERAALHARVADALEAEGGAAAGEIAGHRVAALPHQPDRAVEAAARAGRAALDRLSPHQAVEWLSRALDLARRWASGEAAVHDRLRIELGEAQRRAGDPAHLETIAEALDSARSRGDEGAVVLAALAVSGGAVSAAGSVAGRPVALLEEALDLVPQGDGPQRARLLALLASERSFDPDVDERRRLAAEAVAMARRLGDPAILCSALGLGFLPSCAPGPPPHGLEHAREAVALADRLGDARAQFAALHWYGLGLVQAGRFDRAVQTVERATAVADRLGEPASRWLAGAAQASLATVLGHLDQAERLASRALEIGVACGRPDAQRLYADQLAAIRLEQGRLAELEPLIASVARGGPARTEAEGRGLEGVDAQGVRAQLALARCEGDLPTEAHELLAADLTAGFGQLSASPNGLSGLAVYAEVAARLGDADAAAPLRDLLAPWEDHVAYAGLGAWGSVRRALGRLDAALGDLDGAMRRLLAAMDEDARRGAPVWSARAAANAAEVLLARDGPGDREQARTLLARARTEAGRFAATAVEQRAGSLADRDRAAEALAGMRGRGPQLRPAPSTGATPTTAPAAPGGRRGLVRREGAMWRVELDGRIARVRDTRGMAHLARLLSQPGVELPSIELARDVAAAAADAPTPGAAVAEGLGIVGADRGEPVIDDTARQAFRERVEELEEEREEAERFNDPERAARAAEELDALRAELARALGLAGRSRRTASTVERARVTVTRAIRRAIARIAAEQPAVGRELDATIRTGSLCSYRPPLDRAVAWTVEADGDA